MNWVLRVLASKAGPWVLLGLVIAVSAISYKLYSSGYVEGKSDEASRWEKVKAEAEATATALAQERQARKDEAASWRAERAQLFALKLQPIDVKVSAYEKTVAGSNQCLDDNGVRILKELTSAANETLANSAR